MKIIKSIQDHIKPIAENMRSQDIEELSKVDQTPEDALNAGLACAECYTVIHNDKPVMMFGLQGMGLSTAIVWALGTDDILTMKKQFINESKLWRDAFLREWQTLYNYVDVDNSESIKWLKYLGATFNKPQPRGTGVFMRFEFNV